MSLHKTPLTSYEREGLDLHFLSTDKPSQLSDCFRLGMAWEAKRTDKVKNALCLYLDTLHIIESMSEEELEIFKANNKDLINDLVSKLTKDK